VRVEIPVVHREKALAKGFDKDDMAAWVDILSGWAFIVGASEVGFGTSGMPGGEADLALHLTFERDPKDVLIGDICMRQQVGSLDNPIRLENFDPYTLRPVLAAYRRMQKLFLAERDRVTAMLNDFAANLEAVITQRPIYPVDRLDKMLDPIKFPSHVPDPAPDVHEEFFGEDEGKHV
jgi:hypothetical protein